MSRNLSTGVASSISNWGSAVQNSALQSGKAHVVTQSQVRLVNTTEINFETEYMRQFRLTQQLKQQHVAETSTVANENESKVAPKVDASEPAKKQPETKSNTSKKAESTTTEDNLKAPIEKGNKKHIRVKTSASQVRVPTNGSNTIVLHCDPHVTEVKINVSAAKQHFDMKNSRLYKKKPVVAPSTEPAYHKVPVADKLSTEELEKRFQARSAHQQFWKFQHERDRRLRVTSESTDPSISRQLPDSAIAFYFGKPPFGQYGVQNIVDDKEFTDNHLLTHNVTPQTLPNRPRSAQVFPHAVHAANWRGLTTVKEVTPETFGAVRSIRPRSAQLITLVPQNSEERKVVASQANEFFVPLN